MRSRNDDPGSEPTHRLGDPSRVIGGDGDAAAECAQEGTALVDLASVGEHRDRCLREGGLDLGLARVAEAPLHPRLPQALAQVEGRVAEDDQAGS